MSLRVDVQSARGREMSTLAASKDVLAEMRRVADADELTMANLLELALLAYVEKHHPEWSILVRPERRPLPTTGRYAKRARLQRAREEAASESEPKVEEK